MGAFLVHLAAYINHAWRLSVTGICFAGFTAGGGLLSALFLPLLGIIPGSRSARHLRARRVVGALFGLMIKTLCITRTMRLSVEGLHKFEQHPGALILANHPTLIDVVILLWKFPAAACVVKANLWTNPFYWGVVRAAGHVNNGSPEQLIDACSDRLSSGESLLIFPEGTRTRPNTPLHFVRGPAYVAMKCGRPILPVLITCDPPTLTKGAPWYRIPKRAFEMTVKVLDPISIEQLVPHPEYTAIGARRLTQALQEYFTKKLNAHGHP